MASSLRQDVLAAIPYAEPGRAGIGTNRTTNAKDPSDREEILLRLNELTERFSTLETRLQERSDELDRTRRDESRDLIGLDIRTIHLVQTHKIGIGGGTQNATYFTNIIYK